MKTDLTPYIVCTGEHGRCVSYGYAAEPPKTGQPITLHSARLVVYWCRGTDETGTGLHRLALYGPLPDDRITGAVPATGAGVVQQWLAVTPEAAERWVALP